jgi:hypothetical protein
MGLEFHLSSLELCGALLSPKHNPLCERFYDSPAWILCANPPQIRPSNPLLPRVPLDHAYKLIYSERTQDTYWALRHDKLYTTRNRARLGNQCGL